MGAVGPLGHAKIARRRVALGCQQGRPVGRAGMSEPYQFLFAGGLSFFGTITLSLLTAPTDRNVLRNFYRTTRPFGWWKPLRDELPREQRELIARENRTDILTVPFGMLWQVTLFLLPMQLIIKEYSSFRHTLPLFLVGALGMYFFWWRPLNARSKLATPLPPEPDPSPTK